MNSSALSPPEDELWPTGVPMPSRKGGVMTSGELKTAIAYIPRDVANLPLVSADGAPIRCIQFEPVSKPGTSESHALKVVIVPEDQ